jgi:predicted acyltransferase (DUF342 family)
MHSPGSSADGLKLEGGEARVHSVKERGKISQIKKKRIDGYLTSQPVFSIDMNNEIMGCIRKMRRTIVREGKREKDIMSTDIVPVTWSEK